MKDCVLSGEKLSIKDGLSGRGLFAACDIPKGELITFFGIPDDQRAAGRWLRSTSRSHQSDSYGTKHHLPEDDDHIYVLNGIYYNNKGDANLFTIKDGDQYFPNEDYGYRVGLGWAANSSHANPHMKNCKMEKVETYSLSPHILPTKIRPKTDYYFLVASRLITKGEEIFHKYNLDGNQNRKAKTMHTQTMYTQKVYKKGCIHKRCRQNRCRIAHRIAQRGSQTIKCRNGSNRRSRSRGS